LILRIVGGVANDLSAGAVRIGHLFDGIEETPHMTAQLRRSDTSIILDLSLMRDVDVHHEDWFRQGTVPNEVVFADEEGTVALVECRFGGYKQNLGVGQSKGTIHARHAVFGPGISGYTHIHGLRTELEGLAAWSGLSSVREERTSNDESRLTRIEVVGQAQPPVEVLDESELSLLPYFSIRYDDANRVRILTEEVLVESRTSEPSPWSMHMRRHAALQDLISLAYGWPCQLKTRTVTRDDDPARALDGTSWGLQWLDALAMNAGRTVEGDDLRLPPDRRALFTLRDIGVEGVSRWMREYEDLGRPMWTLAATLFQRGATPELRLLQVGSALEALGYRLAGMPDKPLFFAAYLKEVIAAASIEASHQHIGVALDDDWVSRFNSAYKGVKHADRPLPTRDEALALLRTGVLVARLWLSQHLRIADAA